MRPLQRNPRTRRERQSLRYKKKLALEFEMLLARASGKTTRFDIEGMVTGRIGSTQRLLQDTFLERSFHDALFPGLAAGLVRAAGEPDDAFRARLRGASSIVTVDEARSMMGLNPIGEVDYGNLELNSLAHAMRPMPLELSESEVNRRMGAALGLSGDGIAEMLKKVKRADR